MVCASTICFCFSAWSPCSAVSFGAVLCLWSQPSMNPDSDVVSPRTYPPEWASAPLSSSPTQSSFVRSFRGWNHFICSCVSRPVFPLPLWSSPFYVILGELWECVVLRTLPENKLTSVLRNFCKVFLMMNALNMRLYGCVVEGTRLRFEYMLCIESNPWIFAVKVMVNKLQRLEGHTFDKH